MKRSFLNPLLSFALFFLATANVAVTAAAAKQPVKHTTVLSQTGTDPEPINPPPDGGR